MSQITTHTQLLNALIEKYNLKSYLEIGVQNPANNFDKIICDYKDGCDPEVTHPKVATMTSDMYFTKNYIPTGGFDLIFIDGLHHADQVKRDFENSLRCLSDHGFIVIHDVLPENEEGTLVPRVTKRWWGDVYKFAMCMPCYNVDYITYDIDNGCMLVWKDKERDVNAEFDYNKVDWKYYLSHGRTLMNVTDTVEI